MCPRDSRGMWQILGEESARQQQQQQRGTHSWKCRQMEKTRPTDQKGLRGGGEETTGTEHRAGSAEAHLGTGGVWRWCWKSGKGRVSHNAVSAQGVWAPQHRKCWDTETRHSQSWFREMVMWNTDEDGMGDFNHRKSQSDMRHNQNRKGGVEAQGQLRGRGDNRFGGWNTDLGEHPSCPDFLRHVLLVELLIVRFALRKSRIWARTSVIALIMSRDKGNCHQDVTPGSVKKTVSLKCRREIRSRVCCLGEDLL